MSDITKVKVETASNEQITQNEEKVGVCILFFAQGCDVWAKVGNFGVEAEVEVKVEVKAEVKVEVKVKDEVKAEVKVEVEAEVEVRRSRGGGGG